MQRFAPTRDRSSRPDLDDLRVQGWDIASLTATDLAALQTEIKADLGARDGVSIITCQRYEFLSLDGVSFYGAPRSYRGEDALLHVASLSAGLDSLVLGETQVFGQVRGAISRASLEMRHLLAPAMAAARALRREESFDEHAGFALDYALRYGNASAGGRLLILGGGIMGRRVAERGANLGFDVTVAARRPLPVGLDAAYVPLRDVPDLPAFDVIAGCLGADAPVMSHATLPEVTRLVVDFGTPRNLDDAFDVHVVTIADLLAYQANTPELLERREGLRAKLRDLLNERLLMSSTNGDSPLGSLRGEIEQIRQRELARAIKLHPHLPVETLDTITRSLVNQIFHRPSLRLRDAANQELAEAVAALFQSSEEDGADYQ